ncbi:MAG TPA: formyltransferase family protein, partial [Vicinamibacterales bacterium]|nr:formyltransferase family protein [Vicinamibacterales bacterium]
MQALIDAVRDRRLPAAIRVVISNRADAPGLARAEAAGIETLVMPHREAPSREAYDRALVDALSSRGVRLVCLAGF